MNAPGSNMARHNVWMSEDTWNDLRWLMGVCQHETPSLAIGALIGRERHALDGTFEQTLRERRERNRRRQAPVTPGTTR